MTGIKVALTPLQYREVLDRCWKKYLRELPFHAVLYFHVVEIDYFCTLKKTD